MDKYAVKTLSVGARVISRDDYEAAELKGDLSAGEHGGNTQLVPEIKHPQQQATATGSRMLPSSSTLKSK